MNRLIIDVGNTLVKVAVTSGDKILKIERHETLCEDTVDSLITRYAPKMAIVSSVRENQDELLTALNQRIKKVIKFNSKTRIPIRNLYGTPETLGLDRLAAAVGAHTLFPGCRCMIIDCGTAITIDFLSDRGEFLGGNISPGLYTRFQSLHAYTEKLPLRAVTEEVPVIGTTTTEAIDAGVLQGAVLEIEGYIEQNPGYTAVFTGGDALFFAKRIKNPIFAVCNLVIVGLNSIAEYNAYL